MAKGLGTTAEEEHLPGLHQLSRVSPDHSQNSPYFTKPINVPLKSQHIKGQVGLFFTDTPQDEVIAWFADFHPLEFARSGVRAPRTIVIPAGPVMQHHSDPPEPLPHNEEPQLRKLGMSTTMKKGVPTLENSHRICEKGKKLTPEQAQLLKLVGEKTVEFRVKLRGRWDKDTGTVIMGPDDDEEPEDDVGDVVEENDEVMNE
jgi:mRNA turnover protein 4